MLKHIGKKHNNEFFKKIITLVLWFLTNFVTLILDL
jgi:hypothetical protein